VRAFVDQNAELAGKTMATEEAADALRNQINAELIRLEREGKIPLEALNPLLTIARRFERVSDQAKNICQETLYMCTGEYAKHPGAEAFRLLFVDAHHACLSQMAEGIGHSLSQPKFIFSSAGLDPRPLDAQTAAFLREKGVEPPRQTPRAIHQVPNLDYYQIIVGLAKDVSKALPPPPRKTVYLEWTLDDPSSAAGTPAEVRAAYEAAYQTLHAHIQDLVEAILGDEIE
jgi:arsenate reductase